MFRFRSLWLTLLAAVTVTAVGISGHNNSVSGTAGVNIQGAQTSVLALGSASYQPTINAIVRYTDGTGNGGYKLLWADTSTIAASGADTVKLAGAGAKTDAFGSTIAYGAVKAFVISAATTNVNNVVIGGAADSAWVGPMGAGTHTIAVKPGGWFGWALPNTGWAVTLATRKLKIANSGAGSTVKYTVEAFGIP